MRMLSLLMVLVGATAAWAADVEGHAKARPHQVAETRESAERRLEEILTAPNYVDKLGAKYQGTVTVPSTGDEALRARKNESLRQFREQEALDVNRDLRDTLRQR
jgi:hypothetical protein